MEIKIVKTGYLEENCYILINDNKCLIIDPGDEFEKIKSQVGKKKVLKILVTHHHFDHVGALIDAKKYYNVDVIDYENLGVQKFDDFIFKVIPSKGHKEDSVIFYFEKEKIMFVGDFIFKGTIGRCDLKGGNEEDMKKSLDMIKKYDKNITLYPGHGDETTLDFEMKHNIYLKGDNYE